MVAPLFAVPSTTLDTGALCTRSMVCVYRWLPDNPSLVCSSHGWFAFADRDHVYLPFLRCYHAKYFHAWGILESLPVIQNAFSSSPHLTRQSSSYYVTAIMDSAGEVSFHKF